MPLHYISGCNTRVPLLSDEPFRLAPEAARALKPLCSTGKLGQARSHRAAVATCQQCPLFAVPSYVEPPDVDEVPSPPEQRVGGRTADEAPISDPDLDWDFWGGAPPDEDAAPTTPPPAITRKPRKPLPPPQTTREIAAVIPEPASERRRPKEPPLQDRELWTPPPPAAPPQRLPPYTPPRGAPPSYGLDARGCKVTPSEIIRRWRPEFAKGPSILGHSKLNDSHVCLRRFFWRWVLGLVPAPTPEWLQEGYDDYLNPLDVGSLVHLVLEVWRLTGGAHAWEPLYLLRGDYPALVLEVKRLVELYVQGNASDAVTWDLRAVELESRYYWPPHKCRGRKRRLCISSRHDAVYHPLQRGEPRQPPGTPCRNIRLVELKTTKTPPSESLIGYRVNSQIVQHTATYSLGSAVSSAGTVLPTSNAELYGALAGVMLDWIVKVKDFNLIKHLPRQTYRLHDLNVTAYLEDERLWVYEQIGDRLFSPHVEDPATWPRSWMCHGLFYPSWVCAYHRLCDAAGGAWTTAAEQDYLREPEHTVTGPDLEYPNLKARGRASWKRQRVAGEVEDK